ncbi:MAG: putative membrane protein (DUF2254) [Marinobacter excellens HL-55]|uniref:Putative membrane protein (DUF2254) n=1 Tax=Marinobacter excellens HL-55 TaxID=1305731 RepID=A0A0N8KL56_9GAMM|nr:MAG: putative membrane protein (DUF2254) [Marinobacter excellens HL-55]
METLQSTAESFNCHLMVTALPGTFVHANRPLIRITRETAGCIDARDRPEPDALSGSLVSAFTISSNRTFEDDPRFGLLALSEIADKALSLGINDPGTAINVIGTFVRLFTLWQTPPEPQNLQATTYDRVWVPELMTDDLFDDAFTAIARDGAGMVEVSIRLQKAFRALAETGDTQMAEAAKKHSRRALSHSEVALTLSDDIDLVRAEARRLDRPPRPYFPNS